MEFTLETLSTYWEAVNKIVSINIILLVVLIGQLVSKINKKLLLNNKNPFIKDKFFAVLVWSIIPVIIYALSEKLTFGFTFLSIIAAFGLYDFWTKIVKFFTQEIIKKLQN
jgi:hypothetical protein